MIANLSGKNALVTGSTSGIGLAIAHQLAKAGANIVLNGFGDHHEIEAIRKDLEKNYKIKAIFVSHNLTVPSEIKHMFEYIQANFGQIDILVNNAGMQHVQPIEEM